MEHMDFLTMRSLSQTCRFLWKMMAKHHFYHINKLLWSFHLEPDRIMSILQMTGGVILGSLVLFVMKIGTFKPDDIDFFSTSSMEGNLCGGFKHGASTMLRSQKFDWTRSIPRECLRQHIDLRLKGSLAASMSLSLTQAAPFNLFSTFTPL